jgi:hypothetical protein
MQSRPRKSAKKKVMRAVTVFTGVTAVSAAVALGFGGEAMANVKLGMPYRITVDTNTEFVVSEQVCGYKSPYPGTWTCTPRKYVEGTGTHSVSFGGNWRDGKVNVWAWQTNGQNITEYGYTCNTNGDYYGHLKAIESGVSLTGPNNAAIGSTPFTEC